MNSRPMHGSCSPECHLLQRLENACGLISPFGPPAGAPRQNEKILEVPWGKCETIDLSKPTNGRTAASKATCAIEEEQLKASYTKLSQVLMVSSHECTTGRTCESQTNTSTSINDGSGMQHVHARQPASGAREYAKTRFVVQPQEQ
jgi:hypothetical protein